jgi:hypothetical protein
LQKEGYPEEMECIVQERAWIDESLILEWIKKDWLPLAEHNNKVKYLIIYECCSNLTAAVRKSFAGRT